MRYASDWHCCIFHGFRRRSDRVFHILGILHSEPYYAIRIKAFIGLSRVEEMVEVRDRLYHGQAKFILVD